MKAKGVEFDFTAAPARGFTAGGSLGYTDHKFTSLPAVLITANGGDYAGTLRPKWTAGLWGAYQTPVSGDTNLVVRVDGNWRSKQLLDNNRIRNNMFTPYKYQKAYWIVNGRMALTDVPMGGLKGEVALWSKNMFNSKARTFELINANFEASANYVPARTFGLDLSLDF